MDKAMDGLGWKERISTLEDGEIHYWVHNINADETLVFLHGAGVNHLMFEEQYRYFEGKYNLLAWDARWHGASKAGFSEFNTDLLVSDLNSVLNHENFERFILVGQSMGGNLAQEYAFQYGSKIDGLVLIDCTKNLQTLTGLEKIIWASAKPIFALYPWDSLVKTMAKSCSVKEDVQEYIKKCMREIGKSKFITVMLSLNGFLNNKESNKYPENILLICGEKDQTGNIKKAMAAWGTEIGKNYHLILGASHNANQDQADEVNILIDEFVSKINIEKN